jgi:hypothetical protein
MAYAAHIVALRLFPAKQCTKTLGLKVEGSGFRVKDSGVGVWGKELEA